MSSTRKEEEKQPGPPPHSVHAPWSHLNQSRTPGWPRLQWLLSLKTLRIKTISTEPTHYVWLRFSFWQTLFLFFFFSFFPISALTLCFFYLSSKAAESSSQEAFHCISTMLNLWGCVLLSSLSDLFHKTPERNRPGCDYKHLLLSIVFPSLLIKKKKEEKQAYSRLLSPDAARGHQRRDDGSFNLPSQHNWAACHRPHDLWCHQNVHCFLSFFLLLLH